MASHARRVVILAPIILIIALVGGFWAKGRADEVALRSTGFDVNRDTFPQAFFAARVRQGLAPSEVAQRMPRGATIEHYVAPVSGSPDSVLLERYLYRRGVGSWPVYVYYNRGKGVSDLFAQDQWPSLIGARRISSSEAERWYSDIK